jgi:hypothetical protein
MRQHSPSLLQPIDAHRNPVAQLPTPILPKALRISFAWIQS